MVNYACSFNQSETGKYFEWIITFEYLEWIMKNIIIHSKYFPVPYWLKPHVWFTITSCCSPNLERINWINDVKSAARCKLLNRWRQIDLKSAARCRLMNRSIVVHCVEVHCVVVHCVVVTMSWVYIPNPPQPLTEKPGDEIVLFLLRRKTKSETAKLH